MSEYIKPERSDGLIVSNPLTFDEISVLLLPIYENRLEDLDRIVLNPSEIMIDAYLNICIVYDSKEKIFRIITTRHVRDTIEHFYGVTFLWS